MCDFPTLPKPVDTLSFRLVPCCTVPIQVPIYVATPVGARDEMIADALASMRPRQAKIFKAFLDEGERRFRELCKELVVAPACQERWQPFSWATSAIAS